MAAPATDSQIGVTLGSCAHRHGGGRGLRSASVTLPTFVVAGAPRSGTTSLHYYLRQHPQICMSTTKEPNFFLFDGRGVPFIAEPPIIRKSVRRQADYEALFRPEPGEVAVGDASPLYLYTEPTPARILEVCPAMKVVCLLRRPAERAWSHFVYAFPEEPPSRFAELVEAEIAGGPGYERYRTPTHLVRLGRYAEQVRRQRAAFGDDNVLVLLTDDLHAERTAVLASVCRFLGVDDGFEFEAERVYNTSGVGPSTNPVRRLVRAARPTVKRVLPAGAVARLAEARLRRSDAVLQKAAPLDSELDRRITEWCAADVDELGALLGRDLSSWQVPAP